jgi:hypothetical protein
MPPRKLTPVQVLERLLTCLEKRMEAYSGSSWTAFRWSSVSWKWSRTICAVRCVTWKNERLSAWDYRLSKSACEASYGHWLHLALQTLFA